MRNSFAASATNTMLTGRAIVGPDWQRGPLARRQGSHPAATSASPRWRRTGASQLDGDPEGGLAIALGIQPDADWCGDAQVCALDTPAGRRSRRPGQARHDEVLGITAFRGAEHGEAKGMAGG